ncbi:YciI family protein [Pseudobacillus sp. FSL P4-0506]|uniref:YciI family protein n=1 Tax=unclassified Pseudobacillus TaxID=2619284 RepID=UPI0030F905C7
MPYYAALLHMIDTEKNKETRPFHIDYLDELDKQGKIYARGPFSDGSGGLVVYIADTFEEAHLLAEKDPHVIEKARRLELKEWQVV